MKAPERTPQEVADDLLDFLDDDDSIHPRTGFGASLSYCRTRPVRRKEKIRSQVVWPGAVGGDKGGHLMKKQRFYYTFSGYRWAPESFHARKSLPGHPSKELPLTPEERHRAGTLFLTEGREAAAGYIWHVERARERQRRNMMTYGFFANGEPGRFVYCPQLTCRTDSSLNYPTTGNPATAYTDATADLYFGDGSLGTLKIPAIGVKVKVVQGTDNAALAKGASPFPNTSIWEGNVCVAAHNRGDNEHFGKIHTLSIGDTITFTTQLESGDHPGHSGHQQIGSRLAEQPR